MTPTREDIINSMCLTFRHDYNLVITEDDRMYSLAVGMTEREREALFNIMEQIFNRNINRFLDPSIVWAEHYLKTRE
jgi:hypothetical protein